MVRPSRKRRYAEPHPELDVEAVLRGRPRVESGPGGGQWNVREVAGSPDKTYRCPGCEQEIPPGVGHVVAWGEEHIFGADAALAERRHWHRSCWRARHRRGPR
ncbi:hypothetical protein [Ruania halotolerans]|uniref:hypothetical protein n=1 Tax=Ruania halotolerans TaxID=2897773 RepID=UPI001E3EEE47|nr:hypothetical protein [Ruania halotolerans]UFU07669.1 hypothetical protein LQF10_06080 [Ruania halotolerans]